MRYGIVFATAGEAEPFLEIAGAEKIGEEPLPSWRFSAAGGGIVVVSGMGPGPAAEAARVLIEEHGVDAVVNAGVSAATSEGTGIGEIFHVIEALHWPEGTVACDPGRWSGLPGVRLATVAEPVHDPELRERISRRAELIDMEGAAVAQVCAEKIIPAHLVKGVTDQADESASETIRQNLPAVSRKIAKALMDGLGAPPLTASKVLAFTRVEHTVFSLPLLFAGAWIGAGNRFPSLWSLALIALAGLGARTLGMAMNRILDRDLDARNPRTSGRELPAGALSLRGAYAIALAGLAVYLAACGLLGRWCLILSPVPALVLILYSVLKRFTSLCHFGIGLCLALAPLGAFVATSGAPALHLPVLLLALFAFFWISGYDVIYALQDVESDRRTGVHSLPAFLGPAGAQIVSALAHLLALAALAALVMATSGGMLAWAAFLVSVAAMALSYAPWIPLPARFFPLSAVAGIAGAVVPFLGGLP